MRTLTLALCVALAAGCAATPGTTSPAQAVYAAKSAYAAALTVAVAYESQPRCSSTRPAPCSSPEIVAQLRRADDTAKLALDAAEAAVRTPAIGTDAAAKAAQAATSALQALQAVLTIAGAAR